MRDRYFFELHAADAVAQFFVEANGCFAGVHGNFLETAVAGDIFGKLLKGSADAFSLQIIQYGHLAKAYRNRVLLYKHTAAQHFFFFKSSY